MIKLKDLKLGKKAKVVEISGGHALEKRLGTLGITPGRAIQKVGSLGMHGPATIKVGHSLVAIGRGMLEKILVEPSE